MKSPMPRRFAYYSGVPDINQTSLVMSGLSVDPVYVGQPLSCAFTVSHVRPIVGIEFGSAKDTFGGVVTDAGTGNVILTLTTAVVDLRYGRYVPVRLMSTADVPSSEENKSVIVYVGPVTLFAAAVIGEPVYVSQGVLTKSALVHPATGATTPPQRQQTPNKSVVTSVVIGAGALLAVTGGYIALRRYRKRVIG